ncbi:hypothetical protein ACOME3_002356 [Neoechinorhynchus agilis]
MDENLSLISSFDNLRPETEPNVYSLWVRGPERIRFCRSSGDIVYLDVRVDIRRPLYMIDCTEKLIKVKLDDLYHKDSRVMIDQTGESLESGQVVGLLRCKFKSTIDWVLESDLLGRREGKLEIPDSITPKCRLLSPSLCFVQQQFELKIINEENLFKSWCPKDFLCLQTIKKSKFGVAKKTAVPI